MNILLWILQAVLALHTAMGAAWKFSNSSENMGALKAIPHGVWLGMGVLELLLAVALVVPAVYAPLGFVVPLAALCVAAEMLLFVGLQVASGESGRGQVSYWMVVAAFCLVVAYGRQWLVPH